MQKYLYIVSQKKSLEGDFVKHIENLAKTSPQSPLAAFILREKEISSQEYCNLVEEIAPICAKNALPLFLNADIELTLELAQKHRCHIHTTFANYQDFILKKTVFNNIKLGVSIHSREEADYVLEKNATNELAPSHVLVGHIFDTDCKKGKEGRGLGFLEEIVHIFAHSPIKVIAIGGINQERASIIRKKTGASIALMSSAMKKQMSQKEAELFLTSF